LGSGFSGYREITEFDVSAQIRKNTRVLASLPDFSLFKNEKNGIQQNSRKEKKRIETRRFRREWELFRSKEAEKNTGQFPAFS